MKRSTVAQIIFIGTLVLICVVFCIVHTEVRGDKNYTLTQTQCEAILGRSIEDFMKYPYIYDLGSTDLTGFYCATTEVNEDGNLVLRLTYEQRDYWQAMVQYRLAVANANPDIGLSSNGRKMTVTCTRNDLSLNTEDAAKAIYGSFVKQLLKGCSADKIKVDVSMIDAVTGEIVYQLTADLNTTELGPFDIEKFSEL